MKHSEAMSREVADEREMSGEREEHAEPQEWQAASQPSGETIGRSVRGEPIILHRFLSSKDSAPNVLIFAGIHGDEGTTVGVARKLVAELSRGGAALGVNLYVIDLANPDGLKDRTRTNSRRVDLNRNFPAANWSSSQRTSRYWNGPEPLSEPESRTLHDLVLRLKPARILSLHSIKAGRHGVNYDGPAQALAERLAEFNGYSVLPTMGYPTPGSFGSWAGIDLKIPTITLELPSNVSSASAWTQNREALRAFIEGS